MTSYSEYLAPRAYHWVSSRSALRLLGNCVRGDKTLLGGFNIVVIYYNCVGVFVLLR